MHAYANLQSAVKFARANNSDWLQVLKQLLETELHAFNKTFTENNI